MFHNNRIVWTLASPRNCVYNLDLFSCFNLFLTVCIDFDWCFAFYNTTQSGAIMNLVLSSEIKKRFITYTLVVVKVNTCDVLLLCSFFILFLHTCIPESTGTTLRQNIWKCHRADTVTDCFNVDCCHFYGSLSVICGSGYGNVCLSITLIQT